MNGSFRSSIKRMTLMAGLFFAAAVNAAGGTITDVRLQNTSGAVQTSAPITFGQVFAVGDFKKSDVLNGAMAGAAVPLQVDVKATHADGSVRHAIISAVLPKLPLGTTPLSIATGGTAPVGAANFRDAAATANITLTIDGAQYTASLADALASTPAPWLAGPIAAEAFVDAPLKSASGAVHPLLTVKYGVRWYPGAKAARIEVIVENTWAYEPNPHNVTYDVSIDVGGKNVYAKAALTHYHHARWRKLFWSSAEPAVHIQHNTAYLIASRALPNYNQSLKFSEATLDSMAVGFAANSAPMQIGLAAAYMPMTGGRPDLGLLPHWGATYLLSQDKRAKAATIGTADGAGAYSMHYRDKKTGQPISLFDYPFMTIIDPNVGDTFNPTTGKYEAFPSPLPGEDAATIFTWDVAQQPALSDLPYLVTGDHYLLEELQFWAMTNAFNGHPGYRENIKGLVIAEQTRGQAWTLRTLAEAAYITPDSDRLKAQFAKILTNNLDWFNTHYTNNATANKLGFLTESIGYLGMTAIAPWQDDFFTSAIGHVVDLGFDSAAPLLRYKAQFSVKRMLDACWVDAAAYNIVVRDSERSPVYDTMAQAYKATHTPEVNAMACNSPAMSAAFGVPAGSMSGGPGYPDGYPSNMQPALAYAVESGIQNGRAAWDLFMARSVKPDYSTSAQFAVVPRSYAAAVTVPATPPNAPVAPGPSIIAAPTAAGKWTTIGKEGSTITVPADTTVRYGAANAYVFAKVSGTFIASNTYFGKDPALNKVKTVEKFTPDNLARDGVITTPSSVTVAKKTCLTYRVFVLATLEPVKDFACITPSSGNKFTLTDPALVPGAAGLAGAVIDPTTGRSLAVQYPLTVKQ